VFERYTEPARRVIFFARYEASQFGSATIESEHFLLGLLREDQQGLQRFLPASTTIEEIRRQIEDQVAILEKTSTSIDLPLSDECKRILSHAADESDGLGHPYVDTGHLMLAILCEENCLAAKILKGLGLELKSVREELRRTLVPESESTIRRAMASFGSSTGKTLLPPAGVVPDAETAKRIAEAVWFPQTAASPGDRIVAQTATLTAGVWIVIGSQTSNDINTALAAFIQKEDGKILRIHLEKLDS